MSYGEYEHPYNEELCLEEMMCLLECRTENRTDVSFCGFRPLDEGKILDLSYNDIEIFELGEELDIFMNNTISRIIQEILLNEDIFVKI